MTGAQGVSSFRERPGRVDGQHDRGHRRERQHADRAGLMTMRWKRSRWVPIAWAIAALIGSACDTQTIVPPGEPRAAGRSSRRCASASRRSSRRRESGTSTARAARWPTPASSSAWRSCSPVHSPKSHSSRPRVDLGTLDPWPRRSAPPSARARSRDDVYTASTVAPSAIRSAVRSAWARPVSERSSPAPGRAAPCPSTPSGRGGRAAPSSGCSGLRR